ncbi:DUF2793 domain-containing protein [Variovorax rhizosphaerae]|uniref:DUF2793 domain-containing protein n=1 Tax=Variovorax rhizosphaerae TaxID=1836200 RepID=A0ABU8WFU5_9BURK
MNDNALRWQISQSNVNNATTAQPGSPTEGACYIIQSTHTGAQWSTFTPKDLAIYRGGTWYAYAPVEGNRVSVSGEIYLYTSGAWTSVAGGAAAEDVSYDNATSGLSATDVQGAIDEIAAAGVGAPPIVTASGTSLDADDTNAGNYTRFTNASAKTYTFDDAETFTAGDEYHGRNVGAGDLTLTEGGSFTLNPPAGGTLVVPQGGTFTVKIVAPDEADVIGVTVAA